MISLARTTFLHTIEKIRFAFDSRNPHSFLTAIEEVVGGSFAALIFSIPVYTALLLLTCICICIKRFVEPYVYYVFFVILVIPFMMGAFFFALVGALLYMGILFFMGVALPFFIIVNACFVSINTSHQDMTAYKSGAPDKNRYFYRPWPFLLSTLSTFLCYHCTVPRHLYGDVFFNTLAAIAPLMSLIILSIVLSDR